MTRRVPKTFAKTLPTDTPARLEVDSNDEDKRKLQLVKSVWGSLVTQHVDGHAV